MLGLFLASLAGFLLLLGWALSQRGHAFDRSLDIDVMHGYGLDRVAARSNLTTSVKKTIVYWPPLRSLDDEQGDTHNTDPRYQSLLSVVTRWNPDVPDPPADFHETLQHFNYSNTEERAMASKYRNAELPFKLYDVPDFDRVAQLWSDEYLESNMGSEAPHVEQSPNNHFMYWNTAGRNHEGYVPPTEIVDLSFKKWLLLARRADAARIDSDAKHYYFMTGSPPRDRGSNFISRDLQLFSTPSNNFFITDVKANKGIQCRFGMRGIISEAHYDSGRNMIAMLRGEKRYVLSPPKSCKKLGVITDVRHPSFRHSIFDWSDSQQAASRNFEQVEAIDTIVRTGEVLYVPSYWFHYIISLKMSVQCNSRSGTPPGRQGEQDINECIGERAGRKKKDRLRGGGVGGVGASTSASTATEKKQ
jgi:hypothetical protein